MSYRSVPGTAGFFPVLPEARGAKVVATLRAALLKSTDAVTVALAGSLGVEVVGVEGEGVVEASSPSVARK